MNHIQSLLHTDFHSCKIRKRDGEKLVITVKHHGTFYEFEIVLIDSWTVILFIVEHGENASCFEPFQKITDILYAYFDQ